MMQPAIILAIAWTTANFCEVETARLDDSPAIRLDRDAGAVFIEHSGVTLPVSLACPVFMFDDVPVGLGLAPAVVDGDINNGPVTVTYPPVPLTGQGALEAQLVLEWSPKELVL